MRYTPDETIIIEPEHETLLIEDDGIQTAEDPVEVKIRQSIHSADKPFLTYWEIEYLDSTPNRQRGETVILTENTLSNYEVPVVQEEQSTENQTYGFLAEPKQTEQ